MGDKEETQWSSLKFSGESTAHLSSSQSLQVYFLATVVYLVTFISWKTRVVQKEGVSYPIYALKMIVVISKLFDTVYCT